MATPSNGHATPNQKNGTYSLAHLITTYLRTTLTKENPSMSNTMRWRYGDTCPVMLSVDSSTVIEIGDMLYLDTDDAKPGALQANQGSKATNQQLFHDNFAGV